ncbi:MAG: hypothetical protein WCI41_02645 [bacterium]
MFTLGQFYTAKGKAISATNSASSMLDGSQNNIEELIRKVEEHILEDTGLEMEYDIVSLQDNVVFEKKETVESFENLLLTTKEIIESRYDQD